LEYRLVFHPQTLPQVTFTYIIEIALKSIPRYASGAGSNLLGAIKDSTNAAVAGGINIIKDSIKPAKTSTGALNQISLMAGELKKVWKTANNASLERLFSPGKCSRCYL
jgi:hypothetical protein